MTDALCSISIYGTPSFKLRPSQKWQLHGARSSNVATRAQLRDAPNSGGRFSGEWKRQAAFRWLGDEAEARLAQEEKTYHYVRWTLLVAIAAVIAGLMAVGLAQLR